MEPVALTTRRLVLDLPKPDDVDLVAEYCQDPVFERFMTLPWPYRRRDAEFFVTEFVPKAWATNVECTWALRYGGQFAGVIGYRPSTGSIGFWLGAPHRGRGLMPEAVSAVADWAFEHGAAELRWECVLGNRASAATARKAGFRYTGQRPATIPMRDGSLPEAWHGVLLRDDDRTEKEGWP